MKKSSLFTLKILIHVFLLTWLECHASDYSTIFFDNTEGQISKEHEQDYQNLLNTYFLSEGMIDVTKIQKTRNELSQEKKILEDSVLTAEKVKYIERFNYTRKKSNKTAKNRIKKGKTFLFFYEQVISGIDFLLSDLEVLPKQQQLVEVSRLAYLLIPIKTIHKENIWTKDIHTLQKVFQNFYSFNLKKPSIDASNINITEGTDPSVINPKSSSFWINNKVEEYDPSNERFYDSKLFPEDEQTVFHFKRMGSGSPKIKAYFLEKNGDEEIEYDVTIKLGREVGPELLSAHLARSVGYPAKPMKYRKSIKLLLGDISLEEFKAKWQTRSSGFHSFIGRISYNKEDNSVTLSHVQLEAYPEINKYKKLGPFKSGHNAFNNRREYRALLAYAALINWSDTMDRNVRVDAYRSKSTLPWQTLYFLNDTGMSMGDWYYVFNPGVVNTYRDSMTFSTRNKVRLKYIQMGQHPNVWRKTNSNDMKWITRRYARLSYAQILAMSTSAGYTGAVAELYAEKITNRINDLIKAFKLDEEGISLIQNKGYQNISNDYPHLVTEKGKLKKEIDNTDDNKIWFGGERETISDVVSIGVTNVFQDSLRNVFNISPEFLNKVGETKLGTYDLKGFIKIGGSRDVSINKYHGKGERRYQVTDKFTVQLPIGLISEDIEDEAGLKISLPVGVYYNYTFTYKHSHKNVTSANKAKFFNSFVPVKFNLMNTQLKNGETIQMTKSKGYSIGGFGVEVNKDLLAKINLGSFKSIHLNDLTFSKFNDTLEVYSRVNDTISKDFGINLTAYLRFALEFGSRTSEYTNKFYRFEPSFLTNTQISNAFEDIFYKNDFTVADQISNYRKELGKSKSKFSSKGFFVWDWNKSKTKEVSEITDGFLVNDLTGVNSDHKNFFVFRNSYQRSFGRDLDKLWNDDVDLGFMESLINLGTKAIAEGTKVEATIEAVSNEGLNELEDIQLNVYITKKDNWVTRTEFDRDFKGYFAKRANVESDDYIKYDMPASISSYSPLEGIMHLQVGKKGLKKLLATIKNSNYCQDICQRKLKRISFSNALTSLEEKKKAMQKNIDLTLNVLRMFTGNFTKVERIVKKLSKKEFWLTTRIKNALEYSIPAVIEKDIHLFAPEMGRYQGPTFSTDDKFNRAIFLSK